MKQVITYEGAIYIRPCCRGVCLTGSDGQLQFEEWLEEKLKAAGVSGDSMIVKITVETEGTDK